MRFYAGIGARKTPTNIREDMTSYARWLRLGGFTLRTGHAEGADQAFELGAQEGSEVFLPWHDFEDNVPILGKKLITGANPALDTFVDKFHPRASTLGSGVRKLMRRNASTILGPQPGQSALSSFILCWTQDGRESGGTGQTLRMARDFQIPVFNLFDPNADEKICNLLRTLEKEHDADKGHESVRDGLLTLHGGFDPPW